MCFFLVLLYILCTCVEEVLILKNHQYRWLSEVFHNLDRPIFTFHSQFVGNYIYTLLLVHIVRVRIECFIEDQAFSTSYDLVPTPPLPPPPLPSASFLSFSVFLCVAAVKLTDGGGCGGGGGETKSEKRGEGLLIWVQVAISRKSCWDWGKGDDVTQVEAVDRVKGGWQEHTFPL